MRLTWVKKLIQPVSASGSPRTGSARWYAPKAAYGNFLVEDFKVRKLIDAKLNRRPPFAAVSDILIERTREEVTITLKTARPGLVIGPKGAEVDKLREELEDLIKRKVAPIKVIEIKNPDLNAQLVAEAIAEQLKKRASFRRVLKMRMEATMQAGAKGIRICVSGRLGGAEIARSEKVDHRLGPADDAPGGRELRLRHRLHDLRHDRREGLDLPRHVRRRSAGNRRAPGRPGPRRGRR